MWIASILKKTQNSALSWKDEKNSECQENSNFQKKWLYKQILIGFGWNVDD